MQEKVVVIGAGGHAKVVGDIIVKSNDHLIGFLDDFIPSGTNIIGKYKTIGKIEECLNLYSQNNTTKFIIAIGDNLVRERIAQTYQIPYYTAIHPNTIIGIDAKIGEGTVVMANTCINPNALIGKHTIINTGAIIEHDNIIEDFVHISPNVSLGGTVHIGEKTHIGIGATVKNNINITSNVIIGAGAVVVKNIKEKGTYVGVPASLRKK